jgi:hypothetical protein
VKINDLSLAHVGTLKLGQLTQTVNHIAQALTFYVNFCDRCFSLVTRVL